MFENLAFPWNIGVKRDAKLFLENELRPKLSSLDMVIAENREMIFLLYSLGSWYLFSSLCNTIIYLILTPHIIHVMYILT